MTSGKLVRDLIPEIVRRSGGLPRVRYLSGHELVTAPTVKMVEKAREVVEAAGDTEALIEELAEVTEVMSALMAAAGIESRAVLEAAEAKAAERGRFTTGVWLETE